MHLFTYSPIHLLKQIDKLTNWQNDTLTYDITHWPVEPLTYYIDPFTIDPLTYWTLELIDKLTN